jgi:hypothetical protein
MRFHDGAIDARREAKIVGIDDQASHPASLAGTLVSISAGNVGASVPLVRELNRGVNDKSEISLSRRGPQLAKDLACGADVPVRLLAGRARSFRTEVLQDDAGPVDFSKPIIFCTVIPSKGTPFACEWSAEVEGSLGASETLPSFSSRWQRTREPLR